MEIKFESMCDWERKKAIFLLEVAENLGMDVSEYGNLAVNPNSGYTYLWLEDYYFTLYMPINCELKKCGVYALWNNPETGDETEMQLDENTTLNDLETWAKNQDVEE